MGNFLNTCRGLPILLSCWLFAGQAQAALDAAVIQSDLEQFNRSGEFGVLLPHVLEPHPFYGLASYYNSVAFYKVSAAGVEALEPEQRIVLEENEWFTAVGRFRVMVLDGPGMTLEAGEETFAIINRAPAGLDARVVGKDQLARIAPELDQLRYTHLWWPIAQLARLAEWSLVHLREITGLGWGMTLVLFTFILKALLVPLGLITVRMQRQVSLYQGQLAPVLSEIKSKYDGEEAHKRIMAAHKELGISTFFVLKPMLAMFVQIPIWIAVFNTLGEMPQLQYAGFLWIESLAYPDTIATLPFVVPMFGDSVSLLPMLMTAVTIISALLFQDRLAPEGELKRQKRNLYLIGLAFFVLFYPFPSGMVLYWTLSNALLILQQRIIKI